MKQVQVIFPRLGGIQSVECRCFPCYHPVYHPIYLYGSRLVVKPKHHANLGLALLQATLNVDIAGQAPGGMFRFTRNRLFGSYLALTL